MLRIKLNSIWDFWENLHPLLRFTIFCISLVLLYYLGVKPGYGYMKKWRSNQNLIVATTAAKESRMTEARDLSLSVIQSGNSTIEAFRVLEKSMDALKDPRHQEIARVLLAHPGSSEADRLIGFRSLVKDSPLGIAGQAWASLPEDKQTSLEYSIAFADRLVYENKLPEALSILTPAKKAKPDVQYDIRIARIMIKSGKKQGYDEAQKMIMAGIISSTADLDLWLSVFEELPPLSIDPSIMAPLRSALVEAESLDVAKKSLAILRLDYAQNSETRAEIVEAAVQQWKDVNPVALASFLSSYQFNNKIVALFSEQSVKKNPALFYPLLDACSEASEWDRALLLLDENALNLPKYQQLAHRSVITYKKGDTAESTSAWNSAMSESKATRDANALVILSKIAAKGGMTDRYQSAIIEAIKTSKGPLPLYRDLIPLLNSLRTKGEERTLLELSSQYLSLEPGNPSILIQYAYLACLNDLAEPKQLIKSIEPLAKALPDQLTIQFIMAYIYLHANNFQEASNLTAKFKTDYETLSVEFQAMYLAIEFTNKRITLEDPRIKSFPVSQLLPSEKNKFIAFLKTPLE